MNFISYEVINKKKIKGLSMHVIAIFGILLLISLRVVGLIIAIEFLRDLKESKFKILIIGWLLWIIAGSAALLLGVIENQLLTDIILLINGITTSIALLFITMGLYSYFRVLPRKILAILSITFICFPLIALLFGFFQTAINISSAFLFLIVIGYSIITLKEKKIFRSKLTIKSFYWYVIVLSSIYFYFISYVIFVFQGYSYGFYSDEYSIQMLLNYFLGVILTIVLLIYSIHLEYDISKMHNFNLKDKYSHDLGNLIQVIYSATDLTSVNDDLDTEKAENLNLIKKKCEEAAKIIKDIKKIQ